MAALSSREAETRGARPTAVRSRSASRERAFSRTSAEIESEGGLDLERNVLYIEAGHAALFPEPCGSHHTPRRRAPFTRRATCTDNAVPTPPQSALQESRLSSGTSCWRPVRVVGRHGFPAPP